MTPQLHNSLVVAALLFALGLIGFLTRRNLIVMFLSAEMMLQGVALNLVAFGRAHGNLQGQSFAIFVLTVAACDAAIALSLILVLYHRRATLDVNVWSQLREPDVHPEPEAPLEPVIAREPEYPTLPAAGREPVGGSVPKPVREGATLRV